MKRKKEFHLLFMHVCVYTVLLSLCLLLVETEPRASNMLNSHLTAKLGPQPLGVLFYLIENRRDDCAFSNSRKGIKCLSSSCMQEHFHVDIGPN